MPVSSGDNCNFYEVDDEKKTDGMLLHLLGIHLADERKILLMKGNVLQLETDGKI